MGWWTGQRDERRRWKDVSCSSLAKGHPKSLLFWHMDLYRDRSCFSGPDSLIPSELIRTHSGVHLLCTHTHTPSLMAHGCKSERDKCEQKQEGVKRKRKETRGGRV